MTRDKNPYKVFHSLHVEIRKKVHVVLVRPEEPGNVGAIARAMANMGIETHLRIVGAPEILSEMAFRLAKHAKAILQAAVFYENLDSALDFGPDATPLTIATTAEVGSPDRPHPLLARDAVGRAVQKLKLGEVSDCALVFGPEGDGLLNEEVAKCQWIATIPSSDSYRSLNLAQATLVFCYELNLALLEDWSELEATKPSQKQKLVTHMLRVAEDVGFILPGDPYKMRPRLEGLFSLIPTHVKEAKTLHGLLDQISRSVKSGAPDFKGRYKRRLEDENGRV